MTPPSFIQIQPEGWLLFVKLQPRASRDAIGDPLGSELSIKVTAPPVDSAANEAVIRLLAKSLGIGRSKVELIRGRTSRHKVFRIQGIEPHKALQALQALLPC